MFWMKRHENEDGTVVAACDVDVLGVTAVEDEVTLSVTEAFYCGEKVGLDRLLEAVLDADTTNFVGEELIDALVEADIVDEGSVKTVDGVPHVQLALV